jgi:hypothetical protein
MSPSETDVTSLPLLRLFTPTNTTEREDLDEEPKKS